MLLILYIRRVILRQTEEEMKVMDEQMAEDRQKLEAQQLALMAQQQIENQPEGEKQ